MTKHYRLSPSSSNRWLECHGSAQDDLPDSGSAAADAGTLAHEKAHQVLRGEEPEFPDEDMRKSVFEYVGYVRAFRSHEQLADVDQTGSKLVLEETIESKLIPEHGGTIDALIVGRDHLHVIDYKSGVTPVDPQDNTQTLEYLGLADERFPGRRMFFGSIVQPQLPGDTRCISYTQEQVIGHRIDVMLAGADRNTLVAGGHCEWCPLRGTCTELELYRIDLAKEQFSDDWTADKCLEVIDFGDVMENLVSDAKKLILKMLHRGDKIEGWRLAMSLGNRAWIDECNTEISLQEADIRTEDFYNTTLKSPAQIEKFSKKYKSLVATLCHRPERGAIAVKTDSKLPEYKPENAFTTLETPITE